MTDAIEAIPNRRIQGLLNRLGPDEVRGIPRTFLTNVKEMRLLLEEVKMRRDVASKPVLFALIHAETGAVYGVGSSAEDALSRSPKDIPGDLLMTLPLVAAQEVKDA